MQAEQRPVTSLSKSAVRATPAPGHVRFDSDSCVLADIRRSDINLTVWQRGTAPAVPDEAMLATIDDVGVTMPAGHVATALPAMLRKAGYPRALYRELGGDIAMLAQHVAAIAGCDTVAIRLEIVETDACKRFHSDYVTARLISSYAGRGTQWLPDADAAALRNGADPARLTLRELGTGDVAMFKGRQWSKNGAIIHRSPPIAGTGQRRLVLVIDPAPDAPIPHG